jgi:hypothetical protein
MKLAPDECASFAVTLHVNRWRASRIIVCPARVNGEVVLTHNVLDCRERLTGHVLPRATQCPEDLILEIKLNAEGCRLTDNKADLRSKVKESLEEGIRGLKRRNVRCARNRLEKRPNELLSERDSLVEKGDETRRTYGKNGMRCSVNIGLRNCGE